MGFDKVKIVCKSWGLKAQPEINHCRLVPAEADLIIDCRGIKEHGLDRNNQLLFQEQIRLNNPGTIQSMVELIMDSFAQIPARRSEKEDPYSNPYIVVFVCAHGMHRSKNTKHVVAFRLRELGYSVTVE